MLQTQTRFTRDADGNDDNNTARLSVEKTCKEAEINNLLVISNLNSYGNASIRKMCRKIIIVRYILPVEPFPLPVHF